jgi:uncharacterized alkaline shock family protein YloU
MYVHTSPQQNDNTRIEINIKYQKKISLLNENISHQAPLM